jgi:hypothetical protein
LDVHMFIFFKGMAFIGLILKRVTTQNNSSCFSSIFRASSHLYVVLA